MPISAPPPSWTSIKNKPNTVSGFGITDMASQTVANAANATNANYATTAGNGGVTSINGSGGAITLSSLAAYAASLSSSGYQKLPSGLIIQWGEYYVGDSPSDFFGTWTYPTSFPNAILQVYITLYNTNGTQFDCTGGITSQSLSNAGFTVQEWTGGNQAITAKFLAIGR